MSELDDEVLGGGGDLGEDVEGQQSGQGGSEEGGAGGTFGDESYEDPAAKPPDSEAEE